MSSIIKKAFPSDGLISCLVSKGMGDLKVRVENCELLTIKSIMCGSNKLIRQLVEDELFSDVLVIQEDCTKESFNLLESYYSGGEVKLNSRNCVNLLRMCVYYNEYDLALECSKYIKNHIDMDEFIAFDLLKIRKLIESNRFNMLYNELMNYIKTSGLKLLKSISIEEMDIDILKFILDSNNEIVVSNERELYNYLIGYYNYYKNSGNDIKNVIEQLLKDVCFKNLNLDVLTEEEKKKLTEFPMVMMMMKCSIKQIVIPIPSEIPYNVRNIIINHYYDEDGIILNDKEIKRLTKYEVESNLDIVLKCNDIKVIIIYLLIVIEIMDIKRIRRNSKLFIRLCEEYNKRDYKNEISKCLVLFVKDNTIPVYNAICGKSVLYRILQYKSLLNDYEIDAIVEELKSYSSDIEESVDDGLNQIDLDENIKMKTKVNPITCFCYSSGPIYFSKGIYSEVKPECDGEYCIFTVNGKELFSGLKLDKKTGIISGIVNDKINEKYEIVCRNSESSKRAEVNIIVCNALQFLTEHLSVDAILENEKRTIRFRNNDCCGISAHAFIGINMKKGVHHILYRVECDEKKCEIGFGVVANRYIDTRAIYYEEGSIGVYLMNNQSRVFSGQTNFRTVNYPSRTAKNGGKYEIIYNLNEATLSIKYEDGLVETCILSLKPPFYPFASVGYFNDSITILNYWVD